MGSLHEKARQQLDKKEHKTAKLKYWLKFFKKQLVSNR